MVTHPSVYLIECKGQMIQSFEQWLCYTPLLYCLVVVILVDQRLGTLLKTMVLVVATPGRISLVTYHDEKHK